MSFDVEVRESVVISQHEKSDAVSPPALEDRRHEFRKRFTRVDCNGGRRSLFGSRIGLHRGLTRSGALASYDPAHLLSAAYIVVDFHQCLVVGVRAVASLEVSTRSQTHPEGHVRIRRQDSDLVGQSRRVSQG